MVLYTRTLFSAILQTSGKRRNMAIRFIPTKCPVCSGKLSVDLENRKAVCEYCQNEFIMEDDGEVRVKIINAEEAGEEFEKGRNKAKKKMETGNTDTRIPAPPVSVKKKSDNSGCVKFFFAAVMIWLAFATYCGFSK